MNEKPKVPMGEGEPLPPQSNPEFESGDSPLEMASPEDNLEAPVTNEAVLQNPPAPQRPPEVSGGAAGVTHLPPWETDSARIEQIARMHKAGSGGGVSPAHGMDLESIMEKLFKASQRQRNDQLEKGPNE